MVTAMKQFLSGKTELFKGGDIDPEDEDNAIMNSNFEGAIDSMAELISTFAKFNKDGNRSEQLIYNNAITV